MKDKILLKVLAIIFIVSFGLACTSSLINTEAATHVCNATCYKQAVHQHDGTMTTGGACYNDKSTYRVCGIATVNYSVSNIRSDSSGYSATYKGTCNGCGQLINLGEYSSGPSGSYGTYRSDGAQVQHAGYFYTLICGKTAGVLCYDAEPHVHEGSMQAHAGCYQGVYQNFGVCNGVLSGYNETSGACFTCGTVLYNTYTTCTKCGTQVYSRSYGTTQGAGYCHPNYWEDTKGVTWNTINGQSIHIGQMQGFGLSCGKEAGAYYNSDGTQAIKLCNKKINSITPKTNNQVIVR